MRRWEAVLHPREEGADRKGTPAYLAHRPSGMNQPSLWGWAWALLPRAAVAHTPWKEGQICYFWYIVCKQKYRDCPSGVLAFACLSSLSRVSQVSAASVPVSEGSMDVQTHICPGGWKWLDLRHQLGVVGCFASCLSGKRKEVDGMHHTCRAFPLCALRLPSEPPVFQHNPKSSPFGWDVGAGLEQQGYKWGQRCQWGR